MRSVMSYKHRKDYRNAQKCEGVMTPDLIWLIRTLNLRKQLS